MTLATHLPPELVIRVLDFVDPPALVDLACTCQFLEKCSRDLLRKHRASHAQYRVVTDIAPRSLTEVLRKALVDHHLAWHVRELEFTRDRTEWMHWEKFDGIEELEVEVARDAEDGGDTDLVQARPHVEAECDLLRRGVCHGFEFVVWFYCGSTSL